MCVRRKTPLKPPLGPFLKKGGGFQNPPRYRISQKPRPPGGNSVDWGGEGAGQLIPCPEIGAAPYSVSHKVGLGPSELTNMGLDPTEDRSPGVEVPLPAFCSTQKPAQVWMERGAKHSVGRADYWMMFNAMV